MSVPQTYRGPVIGKPAPKAARAVLPVPSALENPQKSLQINIDSLDDAKSVIQNLPQIKQAYEQAGCDSVEFAIAESIRGDVEKTLRGAVNWCKTWTKFVAPFPGNVHFPLPSFRDLTASKFHRAFGTIEVPEQPPTPVKSSRPVPAPLSET